MRKKHWLEEVLLNFQSKDPDKQHDAWCRVCRITGRSYSSFASTTEALDCVFQCGDEKEKARFVSELKRLVRNAKKIGLSLGTMSTIIYLVAMTKMLDEFAGVLARTFVADWTKKEEKGVLAYELMSCFGMSFKSIAVYKAISFLQHRNWMPDGYACEACGVLLETNPEKWLHTLSVMLPVINRLRNRVVRARDKKDEMAAWLHAEERLLKKLKAIQVTYPQ